MQDQSFILKLHSIRPFKIIESSSPSKAEEQIFTEQTHNTICSGVDVSSDHQISNFSIPSPKHLGSDMTYSQIVTNVSSNFDSLFEKIEKVKEQFQSEKAKTESEKSVTMNEPIQFEKMPSKIHLKKAASIQENSFQQIKFLSFRSNSFNENGNRGKVRDSDGVTSDQMSQDLQQLRLSPLPSVKKVHSKGKIQVKFVFKQSLDNMPAIKTTQEIIVKDSFVPKTEIKHCSLKTMHSMGYLLEKPYQLKIGDFQLGKCIGSGKFGDVYLVRHKTSNSFYALKKIFKSTIQQYSMLNQLVKQLRIHYAMDHPSIVKLYTHFDDEYHIFLLMEYADGGILMDHLSKGEEFVSNVMGQMLLAVDYLQKNQVAHRDIKPENIVIYHDGTMKLCDFGWASTFDNRMKTTFCGTLDYVSPEMKDRGEYTMSVDVWSLGVLTFELLCGFAPYKNEITTWKLRGGTRNTQWNWDVLYPPFLSPDAESFMRSILKQNPDDRATIRMCINHPFIRNYQSSTETISVDQFSTLYQEVQSLL